jgi:hypothetical protein
MSDDEWTRWKRTFQAGGKPMPNVIKRAQTDRRRAIAGVVGFYVIAAGEVAFALPRLLAAKTAVAAMAPLVILVGMLVLGVGMAVSVRGTLGPSGTSPTDLLDALEKRHTGRRRLIRFMPWGIGFVTASTMGTVVVVMISVGQLSASLAATTAGLCAFTAAFGWLVIHRTRKGIDRDLREVAEARRLLAEDAEP